MWKFGYGNPTLTLSCTGNFCVYGSHALSGTVYLRKIQSTHVYAYAVLISISKIESTKKTKQMYVYWILNVWGEKQ